MNDWLFKDDVRIKIKKAYCPPQIVQGNPILDYVKYIIFGKYSTFTINMKEGGEVIYSNYEDLEKDYVDGKLHPSDLKPGKIFYF